MGLINLLALVVVFVGLSWWFRKQAKRDDDSPRRRWARIAQRRAPVRAAGSRPSAAEDLLDHLDAQLRTMSSERHRIGLLIERAQQLRRDVVRSDLPTSHIARLDRQIDELYDRGRQLDGLIGRYQRHRDELSLLARTSAFEADLADLQDAQPTDLDTLTQTTDDLDQEARRLLDVAEAEAELTEMLRAGG
ncbi:MAG TPA: hypothetical protein DCZ72_13965 [Armatimonadetes bacterium]|nr:hypothetical protein [Armatimonadota bacterium]